MRTAELLRLSWMNIIQNKFKAVMTSIGIVVGAATIVLVIGIGEGGQKEIAEQFASLNAGAINISYEYEGEETSGGGGFFGRGAQFFGSMTGAGPDMAGGIPEGMGRSSGMDTAAPEGAQENAGRGNSTPEAAGEIPAPNDAGQPENTPNADSAENDSGEKPDWKSAENRSGRNSTDENTEEAQSETEEGTNVTEDRLNQEQIVLGVSDVEAIETYVSDITAATISYSTRASVEGGELEEEQTYTVAGVKEDFLEAGGLEMEAGDFLTGMDDSLKSRVCVLGASCAKELFGDVSDALEASVYIDDRKYTVVGVLKTSQTVTAGISPDTSVIIPYETGIKYVAGTQIHPVITVIARNVDVLESVIEAVQVVLEEIYPNASFNFEDSGSKMEAAKSSNKTLTMLLSAMAAIVFFVGGIGIMNVLFVSVKERTNEIGILKAIGTPRGNILFEFLTESAAISLIGGVIGVAASFAALPVTRWLDIRVETGVLPCLAALCFAVLTGTVFGIYPAWKASQLEPVDALNAD